MSKLSVPLEIMTLCSVFEDAIDQLVILGRIISNTQQTVDLKFKDLETRAKKYYRNDPIFSPKTAEPYHVAFQKMKKLKLQRDRAFAEKIIKTMKKELKERECFDEADNILNQIREAEDDEKTLIEEKKINRELLGHLKDDIKTTLEEGQVRIQDMNEIIAEYKDQAEDMIFENNMKIRYIKNWENARFEQSTMLCKKRETELTDIINKYKSEIEKELRVHSEIESYIQESQKDMENAIESWMEKYDTDLDNRQMEIQIYKERREDLKKIYADLVELYDVHQKEIDEYLIERAIRLEEERILELMTEAAIKIQAWWRGQMVRHQLGPYNPNPKKKRKKDKGKKGKGKKGKKK